MGAAEGGGKGARPECCRGSMDSACWSVDFLGSRSATPLPECPERPVGIVLEDFLKQFAASSVVDGLHYHSSSNSDSNSNSDSHSNSNSSRDSHSMGARKSRGVLEGGTQKLEDAMGVVQHHDAVSGTAQQHVNDDYTKRLHIGAVEVSAPRVWS